MVQSFQWEKGFLQLSVNQREFEGTNLKFKNKNMCVGRDANYIGMLRKNLLFLTSFPQYLYIYFDG